MKSKNHRPRVAVVGSRDFPNPDVVAAYVRSLPSDAVIVSGGARGVDQWAEEAAQRYGLQTKIFHADWDGLGRRAGPIRNAEIVAAADRPVIFWNGQSRGTLNTILSAQAASLPILISDAEGSKVDSTTAIAVAEENGAAASREIAAKGKD
jgi:YspA, cpYpsA-related SLOG family